MTILTPIDPFTTDGDAPTARLARGPFHLQEAPPREVFKTEADLEAFLEEELMSPNSELANLLDIEVSSISTQRRNGNLRPDILINPYGTGDGDGDEGAEAVLELTLERLDQPHVQRSALYAIECGANMCAIIAPAIDQAILDLLRKYAQSLNVLLAVLILETFRLHDGLYAYRLTPVFGGPNESEATTREEQLLNLVKELLGGMGERSLEHVSVQRNGRLDWIRNGSRYQLYAGQRATRIALSLRDRPDGVNASEMFGRMLQEKRVIEGVVDGEIAWGGSKGRPTGTRLSTSVTYDDRGINTLDDHEFREYAREIAHRFKQFRQATSRFL